MKKKTRRIAVLISLFAVTAIGLTTFTKLGAYAKQRAMPLVDVGYVQTNLASDIPGLSPNRDRNLTNPWGLSQNSAGQFRVAANSPGRGVLHDAQGEKSGEDIVIPPPVGSPAGTTSPPNGVVSNTTSDFAVTLNGGCPPPPL